MLLFQHKKNSLTALFGVGLVGSAISSHLEKLPETIIKQLAWHWDYCSAQDKSNLLSHISRIHSETNIQRINIIWAAGRAGFSLQNINDELTNFRFVLNLSHSFQQQIPESQINFHLISSAGGLFENQISIHAKSTPKPLRPYGNLKLQQEHDLLKCGWIMGKHIYRPTSVYGYSTPGQRMGLIPVLIQNGLRHRVSTIFGHTDTLRDYVLNQDIGRYVANIIHIGQACVNPQFYFLGAGRPTSIFEIRHHIERQIKRKIYFQFRPDKSENTGNISISQQALPSDWPATVLETGIRQVYNQLLNATTAKRKLIAHG